jgi:hypothetical protein
VNKEWQPDFTKTISVAIIRDKCAREEFIALGGTNQRISKDVEELDSGLI